MRTRWKLLEPGSTCGRGGTGPRVCRLSFEVHSTSTCGTMARRNEIRSIHVALGGTATGTRQRPGPPRSAPQHPAGQRHCHCTLATARARGRATPILLHGQRYCSALPLHLEAARATTPCIVISSVGPRPRLPPFAAQSCTGLSLFHDSHTARQSLPHTSASPRPYSCPSH